MSNNRLEHALTVAARSQYANYTMTMVVVGINLFMALYGLCVFLETPGSQRKGRKRYIAASFVITALSAFARSLDMANYFQALFKSTSPRHWRQLIEVSFGDWKWFSSFTAMALLIATGDALLVYRLYIICVEYWWVTILPIMMTLTSLVLVLVQAHQPGAHTAVAASTFLIVSTNVFVTSVIIFRLLRARQSLEKALPSADMRVYTGVISILIESAAPLTIFGIVAAVIQRINSNSPGLYVCSAVFQLLFFSFCALSPHMIIFRVTTGRSFTRFPTPNKDGVLSNPIQFAHQTAESSFLQSTFNRQSGRNSDPDPKIELNLSVDESDRSQRSLALVQEKRNDGDPEKAK